jgi:hypothetical protein
MSAQQPLPGVHARPDAALHVFACGRIAGGHWADVGGVLQGGASIPLIGGLVLGLALLGFALKMTPPTPVNPAPSALSAPAAAPAQK